MGETGRLDAAAVRAAVDRAAPAERAALVGIDGCGGSGKSTLARLLGSAWPSAVVVGVDDFYRPAVERVKAPRVFGGNFDISRLREQVLEPVRAGRAARYQRYDWNEDALAGWHEIAGARYVIVEGVYSTLRSVRDLYDVTIWVDAPYDARLRRGVARDGEGMRDVWVTEWMPAEDRYLAEERPMDSADLVVDGTEELRCLRVGVRLKGVDEAKPTPQ